LLERERWLQSDNAELRALWTASYADFYREPLDLLLERQRLPEAFELEQRYRGRELALALAQPGRGLAHETLAAVPLDVDSAAARLAPRQAAVSFILLEQRSWSLLLTANGLRALALPVGRAQWRSEVEALNVLLALPAPSAASLVALGQRSHGLYQRLLAPWMDATRDIDRLLLLTDDALHELPFAALMTQAADHPAQAQFLVERFALASAVQPFAASAASHDETATLLALGDPSEGGVGTPSEDGLRLRGRGTAPLPAARREALALAALYGERSQALIGTAARERAALTTSASRLHFATHVVLDPLRPLDSYIVLAAGDGDDGLLRAHEVAAAPAHPRDLVVLAGCASRQGANAAGEGLLGLARAWHVSGAKQVLGSTWAIDDAATERFMLAFHGQLQAGQAADLALATTQREWLSQARSTRWWQRDRSADALPFYWGGFLLSTTQP
jgi:CHAT domain-containing protein